MSTSSIEKILGYKNVKCEDLKANEDLVGELIEFLPEEVKEISILNESEIIGELQSIYGDTCEKEKIDTYRENLLYIKQSYYIENTKEKVAEISINDDIFKEIKLEELVDIKDIENNKDIEIDFNKFKTVIESKNEEKEKWNEYNIVNTMSNFLNITEDKIRFISCLSEYIDFISNLDNAVNYVSRGQKDCTYKLKPSLHRLYERDYGIHSSYYESAFRQKIVYYDKEIKNKSEEELRGEGQHFGLPTDYLDFTEAHLISLLFAIEDYNYVKQHSIVYFIDSYSYNKDNIGQSEKLIDYSNESFIESTRKYSSRSFFIKIGNSNERIHFQKGCFLKTSHEDDEFEKKLKDHCKIIIINKDCKKDILKELFNLGITFENIYPDKDNVVKSIKFHYEEMVGEDL